MQTFLSRCRTRPTPSSVCQWRGSCEAVGGSNCAAVCGADRKARDVVPVVNRWRDDAAAGQPDRFPGTRDHFLEVGVEPRSAIEREPLLDVAFVVVDDNEFCMRRPRAF